MAKEGQTVATTPHPPGSAPGAALEELLITLRRSSKDLAFYPPGHPLLHRSLERATSKLQAVVGAHPFLALGVSRTGFSFEGRPVGAENQQLTAMATELFARRIQQVAFGGEIETHELIVFLRMIASDPKNLLQEGGPVKVLVAHGVRRIQVSEFDFQRLGETSVAPGQVEDLAKRGHDDSTGAKDSPQAPEAAASAPALSASQKEPTVEELIQRLERDAASGGLEGYGWTASRLEAAAGQAVQDDRLPDVLAICRVFLLHRQAGNLKTPIRERAALAIEAVTGAGAVAYLIGCLTREHEGLDGDLASVLLSLEPPAIRLLLERLVAEEHGASRERLLAMLARFRLVALPELAEALKEMDQRLACDLATMLGEIGDGASVSLLGRLVRHRTSWVRAEAVRGLARIGGESAHRLLVLSLRDPDLAIRDLAIGFLGAARAKQAIPVLLQLAGQRVLTGGPFAVRKAAVAALGAVGDPGCVPALVALLLTRTWFRRAAGRELRRTAAQALLDMVCAEARDVLEAGARSRRRDVRRACSAALEAVTAPAPGRD